jgi:excisionase family DNA binding protein
MENPITFDQLPFAIGKLLTKVEHLEQLLLKQTPPKAEAPDELLTVQQAAKFLNLTVATIYTKVSRRELPVMKQGKRLHFSKKELLEQLQKGRKKTNSEIEAEAQKHLRR